MKYTSHTLQNGLRVILVPDPQSLAATVLVLVEAGSNYEAKEINGLSHFLEHMMFKGTNKRPTALQISSELDALGAQYNAFTSNEYTGYYAKVQARQFDHALDIVADMYQNPLFKDEEIEKEKGVIIEEINMYEDLPQRRVQELICEVLYGDQPAGWGIAGQKDVIRRLGRADFVTYRNAHYLAPATVLVLAGNFDESTVLDKVAAHFGDLPVGNKEGKKTTRVEQSAPKALVQHKKSDQTHLVLAVRGFDLFHKDISAMEVLAGILGGGMSSRLFQKVREGMGVAYYVRSSNEAFTDHGFLEASAGAENSKALDVVRAMVKEFARIRDERVSDQELQRVKDFLVGNLFLSLETSDQIATFFGGQEVTKRLVESPDTMAEKIQAVTAEDIVRVSKQIFKKEHLNCAVIGPYEDSASFAALLDL